jgi:hypothetical protein
MTLNEAIIKIEGLMENDKGPTRKKEDIGSTQMRRGKKKILNIVAWPRMLAQYRSKPFCSPT